MDTQSCSKYLLNNIGNAIRHYYKYGSDVFFKVLFKKNKILKKRILEYESFRKHNNSYRSNHVSVLNLVNFYTIFKIVLLNH